MTCTRVSQVVEERKGTYVLGLDLVWPIPGADALHSGFLDEGREFSLDFHGGGFLERAAFAREHREETIAAAE
jgi:hypothetical protein